MTLPMTSARQIQKPKARLISGDFGMAPFRDVTETSSPRTMSYLREMVRSRRLELPRPFGHSDLNAARLPVPPRPHVTAPRKIAPGPVGAGPLAKGRERGNARACPINSSPAFAGEGDHAKHGGGALLTS